MEGAQPMVSSSTGSMNSLVDMLAEMKAGVTEGLKQDLLNLQKNFFHKVSRRREMNLQAEAWMKLVRELVFDIEDWLDQKPAMAMGMADEDLEDKISRFKVRVEHARELCERYNLVIEEPTYLHDHAVLPSNVAIKSPILFEKKTGLVAVNDPTDELVKHLTSEHERMLKVVSIVGLEGLGKTTLAREIYAKLQLQGQFDCHAFVTLGRRPLSMRATLMEILRQVKPSLKKKVKPKTSTLLGGRRAPQDLPTAITELWKNLAKKRYFIIVDGIWSTRAWKIINCALPNENHGSRVLTTTCISDVANCCSIHPSDVYLMKGLSDKNCRILYRELIQQEERSAKYDDVTKNMLEVCDGNPLAVTLTVGLSGMKSEELAEMEKVFRNSVNVSIPQHYSTSQGMMKILNMSYAALSVPLKSCLLYLSIFREDYTIKKDRVIRLWVAEGFIPRKPKETRGGEARRGEEIRDEDTRGEEIRGTEETCYEKSLWEIGERYFNELIMRRLIQPVFDCDNDQPMGCTVHGVILDFIKSLSSKGNFVTASADLSSGGSTDTVRRLTLDRYNDEDGDDTFAAIAEHLSRVRSITILGDIEGIAVLPSFKLMRVLDLEDTDHLKSRHLQGIGGLILLRHLGVAGTAIHKLPEEIGELEQLETLDLRRTKLSTLPASIVKQKRLAHLLIDRTVKLPSEIWKMQGLEEVSTIGVGSSSSASTVMEFLRNSEGLWVLGVRLGALDMFSLYGILGMVAGFKLTCLSLDCQCYRYLFSLPERFPLDWLLLRRFELKISAAIPREEALHLDLVVSVTHMDLEIVELDDRAVRALGNLQNLVLLKLVSSGIIGTKSRKSTERRCHVGIDHGFNCLKVFSLICRSGGTELQFTPGAMKELRRFSLGFSAWGTLSRYGNFSFGIEHLSSLTRVHATIDCKRATASEVKSAEDAIRVQVGNLCGRPTIEFTTTHQDDMRPDRKAKATTSSENRMGALLPISIRLLVRWKKLRRRPHHHKVATKPSLNALPSN